MYLYTYLFLFLSLLLSIYSRVIDISRNETGTTGINYLSPNDNVFCNTEDNLCLDTAICKTSIEANDLSTPTHSPNNIMKSHKLAVDTGSEDLYCNTYA